MSRSHIGTAFVFVFGLLAPAVTASSQSGPATVKVDTIAPDWMALDSSKKTVDLKITAALTSVNGGWNLNGYTNGDLTITVPLGWRVNVTFVSRDGNVPHSLGVINAHPDSLPPLGDQAKIAFRGAFTVPFTTGSRAWQEQSFDFVADRTGAFILYCGVPGHAAAGMWNHFVVAEAIARPTVAVRVKEKQ